MKIDYTGVERPMTEWDKEVWISALRSGHFVQGVGELQPKGNVISGFDQETGEASYVSIPTFCCLGVARKVCKLDTVNDTMMLKNISSADYNDVRTSVFLPDFVQRKLAEMNDGVQVLVGGTVDEHGNETGGHYEHKTSGFREIADFIEKEVPSFQELAEPGVVEEG